MLQVERDIQNVLGKVMIALRDNYVNNQRDKQVSAQVLDFKCPNNLVMLSGTPDGAYFKGQLLYVPVEVKELIVCNC